MKYEKPTMEILKFETNVGTLFVESDIPDETIDGNNINSRMVF